MRHFKLIFLTLLLLTVLWYASHDHHVTVHVTPHDVIQHVHPFLAIIWLFCADCHFWPNWQHVLQLRKSPQGELYFMSPPETILPNTFHPTRKWNWNCSLCRNWPLLSFLLFLHSRFQPKSVLRKVPNEKTNWKTSHRKTNWKSKFLTEKFLMEKASSGTDF